MIYKRYVNSSNLKKVKEMDRYCMKCGSSDNLEVHHIVGKGVTVDDHMYNLIFLCKFCHMDIHDRSGYKGMIKILKRYEKADFFRWGTALAYLEERVH